MERFKRTDRLNHQFKEEISLLLQREIKDPRIGFVTLTRVKISEDLSHATIFASIMGSAKERQDGLAGLNSSAGFMRRRLGQLLRIRLTPELHFVLDESADHAVRIHQLLNEINSEQPAAAPMPGIEA